MLALLRKSFSSIGRVTGCPVQLEVYGVGDGEAVDAFFARGNEGLSVKYGVGEVAEYSRMLGGYKLRKFAQLGYPLYKLLLYGYLGHELGVGGVELGFAYLKLGEGEFVVLDYELTLVGVYFEAVGAGEVVGGSDEHARRAVGVLEIRRNIVFDIDVSLYADFGVADTLEGMPPSQLEEVELMGALV